MSINLPLWRWFKHSAKAFPAPIHVAELGDQRMIFIEKSPQSKSYCQELGLKHTSFDISGRHGSVPHDFNTPLPPEHVGKYHIVTNFGTIEHITDQYSAWYNVHLLCKIGGYMLHTLPPPGSWPWHCPYYYDEAFVSHFIRLAGYDILDLFRNRFNPRVRKNTTQVCVLYKKISDKFPTPEEFLTLPMTNTGNFRRTGNYIKR